MPISDVPAVIIPTVPFTALVLSSLYTTIILPLLLTLILLAYDDNSLASESMYSLFILLIITLFLLSSATLAIFNKSSYSLPSAYITSGTPLLNSLLTSSLARFSMYSTLCNDSSLSACSMLILFSTRAFSISLISISRVVNFIYLNATHTHMLLPSLL